MTPKKRYIFWYWGNKVPGFQYKCAIYEKKDIESILHWT